MSQRLRLFCLLLLALLSLAGIPSSALRASRVAPADDVWPEKVRGIVEPALLRQWAQSPDTAGRYIVYFDPLTDLLPFSAADPRQQRAAIVNALRAHAQSSQAPLLALLRQGQRAGHVISFESLWIANAVAVQGRLDALPLLAALPGVRLIRQDRAHMLDVGTFRPKANAAGELLWNIQRVGADLAWSRLELDGHGTVVAVLDTGADWQHPALRASYRGYTDKGLVNHRGNWFCATSEGFLYPGDNVGHGTHVLGTIVGAEGIGIAPGARWIAVKVFDGQGLSYDSWLHAAFQWVLAPEGDATLAPDIVNCSWGSELTNDATFRPDLQALRAAGILPIFAAGNSGPATGSIQSPGGLPEALAVGASDQSDAVASFSARGPSLWGERKPELIAPGVDILSAVPGGGYALWDGTSMAAPHVAGAAALLRQANPTISPTQLEYVITSTATLRALTPDNAAGWGRLDVYQAALSVAQAGMLTGTVTQPPEQVPLGNASITCVPLSGGRQARTSSDARGRYELPLAPGLYQITVTHFGHETATAARVEIRAGETTRRDFALAPLPLGTIAGRVTAADGQPLAAKVALLTELGMTPVLTVMADAATGVYSLAVPEGVYDLRVTHSGYRVVRLERVSVRAQQMTARDATLTAAPTILLVDSGAWYYGSYIRYYQQALDDARYLYDTWTIRDARHDVPSGERLRAYDIVIWSAPHDSPGLVGAEKAIVEYLDSGGRLFLSGQDVAFWDGGGAIFTYAPYFTLYLKAAYVRDDGGRADIIGAPGELFAGLRWPLNGDDSAGNQAYPDVIAAAEPEHAHELATYADDGSAALRADTCLPYRVIYLAAGLEGLSDRAGRAELLARALEWLVAPRPATRLEITPSRQPALPLDGEIITHTVRLRNTGTLTDTYDLALTGAAWPTTLWDATFQRPISSAITIGPCVATTIGVRVELPVAPLPDTTDRVSLSVRSRREPSLTQEVALVSKWPAPVLLVDDDRWVNVESAYESALRAIGIPYDRWEVGWNVSDARGSPPLALLARYPLVVWFTGCDWSCPLTLQEEEKLAAYLDGGGRLFFSSQDYMFARGMTPFAQHYLGVLTYTEELTATLVYGAEESPIGANLGTYALDHPCDNWSDALTPAAGAQAVFYGQHHHPVALSWRGEGAPLPPRTIFMAFPFEALPASGARATMDEIVFWLSPLGDSAFAAERRVAQAGETVTYTLALRNTGITTTVALSNTLPPALTYLGGTLSGGAYDAAQRSIYWRSELAAGEAITLTYRARLASPLADGVTVDNPVHLRLGIGLELTRHMLLRANAPDLSLSVKRANVDAIRPWEPLTYTLTLRNDGVRTAHAQLVDELPGALRCIPGSSITTGGVLTATAERIAWQGNITVGEAVTITYRVSYTAPPGSIARGGEILGNEAVISDGLGETLRRRADVRVWSAVLLPRVGR